MSANSPFDDPSVAMAAAKRLAVLQAAERNGTFPLAPQDSRFHQGGGSGDPPRNPLLEMLSRFLHSGQQTTPATPKRNLQGVEDETEMK